jgi:signal transduction histidine kinase
MSQPIQDDYEALNDFAHDLKNPLGTIKSCLQLVSRLGDVNTRQEEFLERGLSAVERVERMVENLLEYARLDSLDVKMTDFAVAPLLQDVMDAAKDLAEKYNINLSAQIPDGLPVIQGNETLLHSLFLNLLTNAIKYNDSDGFARLEASADETYVTVKVTDNGIGISSEDQERIYDRFFRVDKQRSGDRRGAGLGLSIVVRIVETHNGQLLLESELGRGTSFTVILPVKQDKQASSQLASESD